MSISIEVAIFWSSQHCNWYQTILLPPSLTVYAELPKFQPSVRGKMSLSPHTLSLSDVWLSEPTLMCFINHSNGFSLDQRTSLLRIRLFSFGWMSTLYHFCWMSVPLVCCLCTLLLNFDFGLFVLCCFGQRVDNLEVILLCLKWHLFG